MKKPVYMEITEVYKKLLTSFLATGDDAMCLLMNQEDVNLEYVLDKDEDEFLYNLGINALYYRGSVVGVKATLESLKKTPFGYIFNSKLVLDLDFSFSFSEFDTNFNFRPEHIFSSDRVGVSSLTLSNKCLEVVTEDKDLLKEITVDLVRLELLLGNISSITNLERINILCTKEPIQNDELLWGLYELEKRGIKIHFDFDLSNFWDFFSGTVIQVEIDGINSHLICSMVFCLLIGDVTISSYNSEDGCLYDIKDTKVRKTLHTDSIYKAVYEFYELNCHTLENYLWGDIDTAEPTDGLISSYIQGWENLFEKRRLLCVIKDI